MRLSLVDLRTVGQVVGIDRTCSDRLALPLPSMIAAFFASGSGAIFGNATGGVKGPGWAFSWGIRRLVIDQVAYKFQVFGDLSALAPRA
jgi:PTS system ascorbate-specific IIC component